MNFVVLKHNSNMLSYVSKLLQHKMLKSRFPSIDPWGTPLNVNWRSRRTNCMCFCVCQGDQCFHFFQLKNISFCGCHPKHSRWVQPTVPESSHTPGLGTVSTLCLEALGLCRSHQLEIFLLWFCCRYFGFITKHPDQQRFACHVLMSDTTLHPLAESVRWERHTEVFCSHFLHLGFRGVSFKKD